MNNLKIARKLYEAYNPSYKNKELLNDYDKITNKIYMNSAEKQFADKVVRKKYNDIILKDYHNETVVKYHLTNYLMNIGDYQIMYEVNTNINLNEESSRMSRCDMVTTYKLIDGLYSTIAYEIKTEYDTLKRLPQQIEDYQKIFSFVIVVAHYSKLAELGRLKSEYDFGILIYDDNFNFTKYYTNVKNIVDSNAQINCMTNVFIRKFFRSHIRTREELKDLNKTKWEIEYIYSVYLHDKYTKNWENLKKQIESKTIYPLDYQWFFKNTVDTDLVYNR